jgi:hypothetical protein
MILVSEVEAIRETRSHNTRRIRAKHKNVTAEMKTKTYMAVMVLFRMLTDGEQTIRKRMKKLVLKCLPSFYHNLKEKRKWGDIGEEAIKKNSEEDFKFKWITFKQDSRAKSIKRVNIRLNSFSRTPRGCSDST